MFKIKTRIWIENETGDFIAKGRIDLLKKIDRGNIDIIIETKTIIKEQIKSSKVQNVSSYSHLLF